MTEQVTKELAEKVLRVIDAGLVSGIGVPELGKMCVEAAVCYAMGLPHSDQPACVSPALRGLKIRLNDSAWSSDKARTAGLRRLGVAQLGSAGTLNESEFAKRVSVLVIQKYGPIALRAAAKLSPTNAEKLEAAAVACSLDPSIKNAKEAKAAASAAAYAAASADAAAAAAAAAAAYAYAAASASADASADASAVASAAAAAYASAAAARDKVLAEFGEDVVQILIEMKAPGTQFLYLTEETNS